MDTGNYKRLEEVVKADGVTGKAAALLRGMKPPSSEDPSVMAWRYFVVTVTLANSVALAGHIAIACGLTPWFGGFAYAADQKSAQAQIMETRAEQLEWRMFELRIKQCDALKKGENPQVYTIQLDELFKKYRVLKNEIPSLPQCRELTG